MACLLIYHARANVWHESTMRAHKIAACDFCENSISIVLEIYYYRWKHRRTEITKNHLKQKLPRAAAGAAAAAIQHCYTELHVYLMKATSMHVQHI
jgi:hypothetical protein